MPPNCDMPMDIIEEILLNLPVKSLIRFRRVSPSWNRKISEPSFIRKHLARATRKTLVIINHDILQYRVQTAYSCALPSMSNGRPLEQATDFICPFQGDPNSDVKLRASCDELWCVQVDDSMFLWNPSIRTYKQIPAPPPANCNHCHIYGMGYDSVGDDYKVLKIPCFDEDNLVETQLYSLRSDTWRKIQPFPGKIGTFANGKLVNGALHWIVYSPSAIASFDLSTEKYGEVPQPEYSPITGVGDHVEITVLNGMLCVFVNYRDKGLIFWVMKVYGNEKSWTKINEIGYNSITTVKEPRLAPLYLFEDGEVLISAISPWEEFEVILLYKDEHTTVHTIVDCSSCYNLWPEGIVHVESLIYIESLISPTIYPIEHASRIIDE